jgi:hypothetical protein
VKLFDLIRETKRLLDAIALVAMISIPVPPIEENAK